MPISFTYRGLNNCPAIDPLYLNKLVIDAASLLDAAIKVPDIDKMKYWFGDKNFKTGKGSPNYSDVVRKTGLMKAYLEGSTVEFISKDIRSGAFADQDELECRIYLAQWFGMKIYSYGERLVTLIHEASHKTPDLRTKDIPYKDGKASYKHRAVLLAKSSKFADALRNAENWGYYVASYARPAGLMSGDRFKDWTNVKNVGDIERKPAVNMHHEPRLTVDPTMHLGGKKWTDRTGRLEGSENKISIACVDVNGDQIYEFDMGHNRLEKKILDYDPARSNPLGGK